MQTIKIEKSKSENYPIYIGNEIESREELNVFPTLRSIINWNFEKPSLKGYYFNPANIQAEDPADYMTDLSLILRFAEEYNSTLFVWMISNLYEIMDQDKEAMEDFVFHILSAKKSIYEKKTKAEREQIPFSRLAQNALTKTNLFLERDVISMSMILESFVSYKMDLLSMEEYYEIRDMFVPFGLGISQIKCKPDDLVTLLKKEMENISEFLLLKKLGKTVLCNEINDEIMKLAAEELYFDESAND
ncbi:MAG: hypothetical protein PUE21_08795 [Lachnospiraceae bacterium]|nr:hypothetical protein [Lachnospiraceae bacterium]